MCDAALITAVCLGAVAILGAIASATATLVTASRANKALQEQGEQLSAINAQLTGRLAAAIHEVAWLTGEITRLNQRLAGPPRPLEPPPGMLQ